MKPLLGAQFLLLIVAFCGCSPSSNTQHNIDPNSKSDGDVPNPLKEKIVGRWYMLQGRLGDPVAHVLEFTKDGTINIPVKHPDKIVILQWSYQVHGAKVAITRVNDVGFKETKVEEIFAIKVLDDVNMILTLEEKELIFKRKK